jgi:alpha-tubulin suppressor-like RCC1 family protein
MWGNGQNYALGTGNLTQQNAPVLVNGGAISGKTIKKVWCGGGEAAIWTYVTDIDDNVYSVGYNNNGQCGTGGVGGTVALFTLIQTTNVAKADQIYTVGGNNTYVTAHAYLVRSGVAYAAGYGTQNSLGQADQLDRGSFVPVTGMAGKTVTQLAVSGNYANAGCSVWALCSDGTIMSWGRNDQGQLGRGSTSTSAGVSQVLSAVDGQNSFTKIKASGGSPNSATVSMVALGSNGKLYGVGYGGYSNHGNSSNANQSRLVPALFNEEAFVDFTYGQGNGSYNVMAKGASGKLYAWGSNLEARSGLPSNSGYYQSIPHVAQISF